MGVTTHLQLQKTKPIDPFDSRARILFERKTFIPFAWFLFFSPDEVIELEDGTSFAVTSARSGLARAKRRVKAIAKVGTPRLVGGLGAWLEAIAKAGAGFLVLHPYRIEASKKELQRPMAWLDSLEQAPSVRALKKGEALFEDDDEGLSWEDADGKRAMDCESLEDVIGWPIRAPKVKWRHPPTPEPVVDPVEAEAARRRQAEAEAARTAQEEALRRPVSAEEFAGALASGDDAAVEELLARQERAEQPGRLEALLRAAFEARRFTALAPHFSGFRGEEQATLARGRLEAALAGNGALSQVLLDVDRSEANRGLLAPFARRAFDEWKDNPASLVLHLSPILYALPSATFTRDEWERLTRGAEERGNEALIWRCKEHLRVASA